MPLPRGLPTQFREILEGDGARQVGRFDELAGLIGGNFAERSIDALLPLVKE